MRHLLLSLGGLFFLHCNFDIKDYTVNSLFYSEILAWWSEFRENFASTEDWRNILWNNKEIRINNSPIFYKNFFDSGIVRTSDLLLNLTLFRLGGGGFSNPPSGKIVITFTPKEL